VKPDSQPPPGPDSAPPPGPSQSPPPPGVAQLHGRLSLRERLTLLVLISLLPLAALSIWFAVGEMRAAIRLAQSQLRFAASLVAAHQDLMVESAEHLLGAIAAMPEMRAPERSSCERYFEQLRGRYPVYANIGLFDSQGRMVCHANARIADFNAADRPYFIQAITERRFVMGTSVLGRITGRWVIPFAQPVFDGTRVTGVVFAGLDLGHADAALAATDLPDGARVTVADRRGTVLIENPAHTVDPEQHLLSVPALVDAARSMTAGSGEWDDKSGQSRIFAFAPSRLTGGEGFLAAVSLDRSQVIGAALASLRYELLALAVALVASGLAAWWLGGRMIVRPAQQIVRTVRQLERGALSARVPLQAGSQRGEFARIAAAFNLMAQSLQLRQIDLEAELGRSRSAYAILDLVLNSMDEALVAVTRSGRLLLFNEAAARLFPLDGPPLVPQQWAEHFGFFRPDGLTPYLTEELPMVRSAQGESGRHEQLLIRNARVPEGRQLQCSWQPIQGEGAVRGGLVVFTDVTERRKTEADLVLLRKAVTRVNDIVLITEATPIDWPGPRIVFVNEAFERLTGYTAQEAIGNTPRMLQGPKTDRAALARIREALSRGLPVREELVNYAKDGREFWLDLDIIPLFDESGVISHLIAVERDITARKQAERALRQSERELHSYTEMLQRMTEAAQAITAHASVRDALQEVAVEARRVIGAHQAVVNLAAGGDPWQGLTAASMSRSYRDASARPGDANASSLAMLALEPGQTARLTQAELQAHRHWGALARPSQSQPPLRGLLAVPLVGSDGGTIGWLKLSDKNEGDFTQRDQYVALELAQLAAVAIENSRLFAQVTELNASLEARIAERTAELARQSQLHRTLAEQAPEVVWHTDPQGHVTFLSRAWSELVGPDAGKGLGYAWLKRVHPDDIDSVRRKWQRAQETLAPYMGVRRILARDGSYHTMSYKGAPVFDADGKIAFWVGIDADISEVKAIEAALRSSNRDLEAFSYSISHELRAPLGAIEGFGHALALQLEGHPEPRVAHYLSRIQAGVQKMDQSIEALLSLAQLAHAPLLRGTVDLGAIAREILEGRRMQQPQRRVRVQVQDGLVAQGDARLLRLVMENLLGNAWKFSSQQEEAVIEVGRLDEPAAFYVRDNGAGFDMAYVGKLFGAFQRLHTEAEFPGSGIGLATVARVMERHHGTVWAESQPGQGACFFFALPPSAPPPESRRDQAGAKR
jgi:PAS domain S-box-containing protein